MKRPASLGAAATGHATNPSRPKRSESAQWPPRKLLLRAMDKP